MTFVKPPLPKPAHEFSRETPRGCFSVGYYDQSQLFARDAEMLRAVADWLEERAGRSPHVGKLAAELRKAANAA